MKNTKSIFRKILSIAVGCILLLIIAVAALLSFLSITEYRPDETTALQLAQNTDRQLSFGKPLRIITWNTGYCGLDQTQDFFMDGGTGVRPDSAEEVKANLLSISKQLQAEDADILLLQEVDVDSKRSFYQDQEASYRETFPAYTSAFAYNFKVPFVPYPIPPIGKVNSGIMTLSRYQTEFCERTALPTSFNWPVRTAQLKRCLLVSHIPIADSTKELIVVNLHLEAYDDGSGKIAQTKVLKELLEAEYEKGNYVIAGGDFNQIFSCVDSNRYPIKNADSWRPGTIDLENFETGWQFAVDDTTPTCRLLNEPHNPDSKDLQYYVIDGYILSPNITLKQVKTIDLGFSSSDHNPVSLQVLLT